jgi:hypothetical protein
MDGIDMASGQCTTSDSISDPPVLPNTGTQLDVELVAHDSGYQVSHSSAQPIRKLIPGAPTRPISHSVQGLGYPADAEDAATPDGLS